MYHLASITLWLWVYRRAQQIIQWNHCWSKNISKLTIKLWGYNGILKRYLTSNRDVL